MVMDDIRDFLYVQLFGACRRFGMDNAKQFVVLPAERLVDLIKPAAKSTARPGAEAGLGGFAAVFDPKAAGFK